MSESTEKQTEKATVTEPTSSEEVVKELQEKYDTLYKSAIELQATYSRLLKAYNVIMDLYLSGK